MRRTNGTWVLMAAILAGAGCAEMDFGDSPLAVGTVAESLDVLFMIDGGGSTVAEQRQLGKALPALIEKIEAHFGTNYHLGVVTVNLESAGCPPCNETITLSCVDETLEGGRLRDRLGKNLGTDDAPNYEFSTDPACGRILTSADLACFYDDDPQSPNFGRGRALTGFGGCGYERGLESVRRALGEHADGYNAGFLRPGAALLVVYLSDEEDCGNVGDVNENIPGISSNICYYAAKGEDPEGHTKDPNGKVLALTPVSAYFEFLQGVKPGPGMVRFAAIVGVEDVADPGGTEIRFVQNSTRWDIVAACTNPACTGRYCAASPGTRSIALARMFGLDQYGYLANVCQSDYTQALAEIGELAYCPRRLHLARRVSGIASARLKVNDTPIPADAWSFQAPTTDAPDGAIVFAQGFDLCGLAGPGEFRILLDR